MGALVNDKEVADASRGDMMNLQLSILARYNDGGGGGGGCVSVHMVTFKLDDVLATPMIMTIMILTAGPMAIPLSALICALIIKGGRGEYQSHYYLILCLSIVKLPSRAVNLACRHNLLARLLSSSAAYIVVKADRILILHYGLSVICTIGRNDVL